MTPQRIALIAVLVAGVVAVPFCMQPPPSAKTHDKHEQFRVQLDVSPVEAALWFANRYPGYFTTGEKELGPWLDGLPAHERDFVIAMGQTLMWAWVEREVAGLTESEASGLAREASVVIRRETLNQLDLNAEQYPETAGIEFDAFVGEPEFGHGTFARLVRGVSNCEGQNHLLAVLLDAAMDSSERGLAEVEVELMAVRRGHELVRLVGGPLGQPIYVDAWSNLPPFTLERGLGSTVALADLGENPLVPGAAGRAPFEASVYAAAHEDTVELLPKRDAPTKPVDLRVAAPVLDDAGLARVKDPWKLYLFARILHLYGDPRAADLYRLVVERRCGEPGTNAFVCAASSALLGRME